MSQFSKLFEAVKDNPKQENAPVKKPVQKSDSVAAESEIVPKIKSAKSAEKPTSEIEKPAARKEKRAGKSSSREHAQVLTYIRKDTHKQIKMALMDDARDLSDLVEELLTDWLREAK